MSNLNLEDFRNKIDMVDDKILELLNERMSYVK
ncbi:TPA: chorismate mutase, partial [Campylobacter coli]|nr:chorismate mutase [Campylobacter coli]